MATQIFVNLPVKDLKRTTRFFSNLGYSFNPQFSDENGQCMIISDDIYVMLLVEPFFRSFTNKEIPDNSTTCGTILSLSLDSPSAVNDLIQKCIEEGGTDLSQPQQMDFMYNRAFEDPDGHRWEVFYMDMAKVPKAQPV